MAARLRPSAGEWFLDLNRNGIWENCNVDRCIASFGKPGDLSVAGDWNATGSSKTGLIKPGTAGVVFGRSTTATRDGARGQGDQVTEKDLAPIAGLN